MTDLWIYFFINFVLPMLAISCYPINNFRVPRNEVQYSNGTIVGRYSYADDAGNPIAVKYYADKSSYGVELNSFKTIKVIDTSTSKETLHNPKPMNDYMEPMKPLLHLAAEIMNFDRKQFKTTNTDTSTIKPTNTLNPFDHVSKIKLNTPDYEKYYQNEVKAPKQCEKDKVRVYLAKEKRKKKNAIADVTIKAIS